jgi:ribonuclease HII
MYVIGSDECGFGSWAGPLYVCAYVAEDTWTMEGLGDSKELTPTQRREVYGRLDLSKAVIISVEAATIDKFGLGRCLVRAHTQAITQLIDRGYAGARIVVDGSLRLPIAQAESIPKADGLIPSVMAASIIAKCNRDFLMKELHHQYPLYGFASHVGYGTPEHMAALAAYGPCPLHRMSYRPLKELVRTRSPTKNSLMIPPPPSATSEDGALAAPAKE